MATLNDCLHFVSNESPGSSDEHKKNLAKGLLARCEKYKEPIARAWLHWDELTLTELEVKTAGIDRSITS